MIVFMLALVSFTTYCNATQELLPVGDRCIVASESLTSGLSNDVTKYTTSLGNHYVMRVSQKLGDTNQFRTMLHVAQRAAELELSPHIYSFDESSQSILMRYVPAETWPAYEEDERPYHATMRMLRKFHDGMRSGVLENNPTSFQPFSAILSKEKELLSNPYMPYPLATAFIRMRELYERARPWLATHASIYQGDMKKKNVLLEQHEHELRPWLIDFDYAGIGHPYFDVVKFSQKLPAEQRQALFYSYLGRVPTAEETVQFHIADAALRMLIAIIRFGVARKTQEAAGESTELLLKQEMEDLLNAPTPLPSQAIILLSNPDPKQQQLAALYALDDFLRNS
jgi:aminoglycoside phosphotransferase (APT) family kinase protein